MTTYIASTAELSCNQGDKKSKLFVSPSRTIFLNGKPKANISDHISMKNILPFGKCRSLANPTVAAATAAHHGRLTPMPCVPNTPMPWMIGKKDVIEKGDASLKKDCRLQCIWNGIITINNDGQNGRGCGIVNKQQDEYKKTAINNISEENKHPLLDKIQLTLDLVGFVPAFGAIPDLINAGIYAYRGDKINAGLSAVAAIPGFGDAAGAIKVASRGGKLLKDSNNIKKTAKSIENTSEKISEITVGQYKEQHKLLNISLDEKLKRQTKGTTSDLFEVKKLKSGNPFEENPPLLKSTLDEKMKRQTKETNIDRFEIDKTNPERNLFDKGDKSQVVYGVETSKKKSEGIVNIQEEIEKETKRIEVLKNEMEGDQILGKRFDSEKWLNDIRNY